MESYSCPSFTKRIDLDPIERRSGSLYTLSGTAVAVWYVLRYSGTWWSVQELVSSWFSSRWCRKEMGAPNRAPKCTKRKKGSGAGTAISHDDHSSGSGSGCVIFAKIITSKQIQCSIALCSCNVQARILPSLWPHYHSWTKFAAMRKAARDGIRNWKITYSRGFGSISVTSSAAGCRFRFCLGSTMGSQIRQAKHWMFTNDRTAPNKNTFNKSFFSNIFLQRGDSTINRTK